MVTFSLCNFLLFLFSYTHAHYFLCGVLQLTLPPWPMYRRNPLTWQPTVSETPETREKPQENLKKKKHK